MKIVDERKEKYVQEEWNIGDVIEFGDNKNSLSLGMIIQDDDDKYWLLNLGMGDTIHTDLDCYPRLDELIKEIRAWYNIARKVNVELHIKEGE